MADNVSKTASATTTISATTSATAHTGNVVFPSTTSLGKAIDWCDVIFTNLCSNTIYVASVADGETAVDGDFYPIPAGQMLPMEVVSLANLRVYSSSASSNVLGVTAKPYVANT